MVSRHCTDHKGREFPSMRAMCRAWGIGWQVFLKRRTRGWPLERALTEPKADPCCCPGKAITDYD